MKIIFGIFWLLMLSCDDPSDNNALLVHGDAAEKHSVEFVNCRPTKNLSQSNCAAGFLCVKSILGDSVGRCLKECGKNDAGMLRKNPTKCPNHLSCLLLRHNDLAPVGMFCLPTQKDLNARCEAPLDSDACKAGNCIATAHYREGGKTLFGRFRCKEECSLNEECGQDKSCLWPSYARKEKQSAQQKPLRCDVKLCESNDLSCVCDSAQGFSCEPLMSGLNIGVCLRRRGVCGQPVRLAKLNDFNGSTFMGPTCDEIRDHRICVSDNAVCYQGGNAFGACILPCSDKACPIGLSCSVDLAKKLNLYNFIDEGGKKKPCDPKKCEENQPCAECGEAGFCVRSNIKISDFFCATALETCINAE